MASRYGYGDWSDDDDDDEDDNKLDSHSGKLKSRKSTKRKSKKRTKRRSSREQLGPPEDESFGVGDLFDGDDSMEAPMISPSRKKRSKGSRGNQTSGAAKIRPAMELLNETKKVSRKKRHTTKKVDPMVSSIDILKNKNEQKQDKDKLIRPALHSLREAESKLKKAADKPDDI